MIMGVEADTTGKGVFKECFDRVKQNRISSSPRPFTAVLPLNSRLPQLSKPGSNKILSEAVRDWTIGTVIQDASGLPILAPYAQNSPSINSYLFRNPPPGNTTLLGFTGTFANRVPGQPLFLKDLNCHCIDPRKN